MISDVIILFASSFCYFECIPEEVEVELYNYLLYRPEGYFYSPKYQSGIWDGYFHLYYPKTRRFRSGLLKRVEEFLRNKGCIVEIKDKPESKKFKQRSNTYQLRPYQLNAVNSICEERFGILKSPPRSGKTMMFIATVDSEREFPVVFYCRSLDLAYQTVQRIVEFLPSIPVGLVGDGKVDIQKITVVTIQSAYAAYHKKYPEKLSKKEIEALPSSADIMKIKGLISSAKIIFYDETHHVQSATSKFIIEKSSYATMKIGLSATPHVGKEVDITVEEAVGPIIHEISYSDLIRDGYLLKPYIYMYKLPKVQVSGNYKTIYKQAVTDNNYFLGLIAKITIKLNSIGKSVVIQAEMIPHIKNIAKRIPGSVILTGSDKSDYRLEVINKLRNKEVMCVVSTLFEEGIDVLSLDYTINAAGGLGTISTLQRMRSITACEGKNTCGIIDFYHDCKYLRNHSLFRKNIYLSEPEFVLIVRDISKKTLAEIV